MGLQQFILKMLARPGTREGLVFNNQESINIGGGGKRKSDGGRRKLIFYGGVHWQR
jgi:hypothetical protein